jgi:GNAT superfamily N-acetyltransferase
MAEARPALRADLPFLRGRDHHVAAGELGAVVARGRVLLLVDEAAPEPLGWLRWGLFWDAVPFMFLLHVLEAHRGGGLGRQLVTEWESRCRDAGHDLVLTSTMSDEQAQHFLRHLGYLDSGTLELPGEAPEILLRRALG